MHSIVTGTNSSMHHGPTTITTTSCGTYPPPPQPSIDRIFEHELYKQPTSYNLTIIIAITATNQPSQYNTIQLKYLCDSQVPRVR